MLIALAISAALLTATLAALNASFQHYKSTTESASTHVVSRNVMHRMLTLIRTGADFGPFPTNVLDTNQNPITSDFIEFVSQRDLLGGIERITRIEFRPSNTAGEPGELWYVLLEPGSPDPVLLEERPLLSGVRSVVFTLHYDIGPRLRRATIDMTVEPNDSRDLTIGAVADTAAPRTIRLVASAAPRQLM